MEPRQNGRGEMENLTVFQIDWLRGDVDDVELFRFSISPFPSLITHCYLQTYSIENCLHVVSQFLSKPERSTTHFTFNSFNKSDAGGAVELQLFRRGVMAELRLTLIDASSKDADLPPDVIVGKLTFESIGRFVDGLKGINAGTVTPAVLHFSLVDQTSPLD